MFGDNNEKYIERYQEILEDLSIEDVLEQNDLLPEEALYILFEAGHLKNPFSTHDEA